MLVEYGHTFFYYYEVFSGDWTLNLCPDIYVMDDFGNLVEADIPYIVKKP